MPNPIGVPGLTDPLNRTVRPDYAAMAAQTSLLNTQVNVGRVVSSGITGDGLKLLSPAPLPKGGPFYPYAYVRDDDQDDKVRIGINSVSLGSSDSYSMIPGRSASTPGVLQFDGCTELFTAAEEVDLYTSGLSGTVTRLLCLRAVTNRYTGQLDTDYYYLKGTAIGTTIVDWIDSSGITYFPLGWITYSDSSGNWKIRNITWGCTEWLLEGHTPKMEPLGGPFYPSVNYNATGDTISIGGSDSQHPYSRKYFNSYIARSSSLPGVLQYNGYTKTFTSSETVSLSSVSAGSYLLCLRAVVTGTPKVLNTDYYFLLGSALGTTVVDWEDAAGYHYFPLGWVTVITDGSGYKRVSEIRWPCSEWLLQGGRGARIAFVQLTAKVNYNTYTGNVYEGSITATETGVTIKIGSNIASTATLPVGSTSNFYLATIHDWAGTEYWTAAVPLIG